MLRYLTSRLIVAALMVLLATLVIFLIANMVPGDPVLTQLGDIAASDPTMVAAFRHKWGLDLPLWDRYWIFLTGVFHGDLGVSISSQRPVLEDIAQYAPATVELSTIAFLLSLVVGLPLGVLAAMKRDSWIDHLARTISLIGVSAPTFWLAFVMLIDAPLAGDWDTFWDAAAHLVLPSIVLAASTLGLITRTTRAAMLEALSQDYIRVARAKGLMRRAIMMGHALPNALLPVVTLGGLAYAQLLTGTVLTESIFSWPGLGRYTFQSAVRLDFPAIMGITLVVAAIYVVINLLVDLSYAALDPRVSRR
jgi:peptide/nickel transport system permease protein